MGKHDINAFLGAGTSFTGRLAFDGVVRIDGAFDGEIVSGGTLLVGQKARIAGRIAVGRLTCGGSVAAEVTAAAKVTVTATGHLTGSVRTPVLVVEEGGGLDGEVVMGEDAAVAVPRAALAPGGAGNVPE
ncbi:MAG: polymer-forming cytoskeletal protein [Solidesulfovibrio sp.]|uniref:bactofilin family protein n=1 Tax=Solidesulfovibrio sp. TaxID=2910990 RepID=UPI002B20BD06|nr:polymer-forming cytoskeletal protein [Solidesulfovibrio sp.]MEA4855909.1 polymer-forming cytoskeletal protein [Solidesulfovibrio sp.]